MVIIVKDSAHSREVESGCLITTSSFRSLGTLDFVIQFWRIVALDLCSCAPVQVNGTDKCRSGFSTPYHRPSTTPYLHPQCTVYSAVSSSSCAGMGDSIGAGNMVSKAQRRDQSFVSYPFDHPHSYRSPCHRPPVYRAHLSSLCRGHLVISIDRDLACHILCPDGHLFAANSRGDFRGAVIAIDHGVGSDGSHGHLDHGHDQSQIARMQMEEYEPTEKSVTVHCNIMARKGNVPRLLVDHPDQFLYCASHGRHHLHLGGSHTLQTQTCFSHQRSKRQLGPRDVGEDTDRRLAALLGAGMSQRTRRP